MKGDTVVGGRRHKIGWKGRHSGGWRRHSMGWKEIQWWMEGHTTEDARRYSGGWKKTQHRMKGSIQWWMEEDTKQDGRGDTDDDGSSGGETEIQRYRGGGKETLRWGENAVLRPLIEDPALAGGGGGGPRRDITKLWSPIIWRSRYGEGGDKRQWKGGSNLVVVEQEWVSGVRRRVRSRPWAHTASILIQSRPLPKCLSLSPLFSLSRPGICQNVLRIASFHSSLFDIFFYLSKCRVFFVSVPLSYGISLALTFWFSLSFSVSLSHRILLPIVLLSVCESFCLLNLSIFNVCEEILFSYPFTILLTFSTGDTSLLLPSVPLMCFIQAESKWKTVLNSKRYRYAKNTIPDSSIQWISTGNERPDDQTWLNSVLLYNLLYFDIAMCTTVFVAINTVSIYLFIYNSHVYK